MATQPLDAEPAEAPPQTEPVEPSGEPTSPEQPEAVEAAQETPETTAEPPSEPVPSPFDLSDEDVKFASEKFGGDVNALARAWKETNNRAAEMARKLKEQERPQEQKPPQIQEARPEAPPRGDTPDAVEEQAYAYVRQDRECIAWRGEWTNNNQKLDGMASKAATLDHQIGRLEARLDGETFKGLGFEESLDEFSIRSLKDKLHDLKQERRELIADAEGIQRRNKSLADAFDGRLRGYKDRLTETHEAQSRERQEQEQVEQAKGEFATEWKQGLDSAFKTLSIPNDPKLRERLNKKAQTAARAQVAQAAIPQGKVGEFVLGFLKEEIEDGKVWTQHEMKTYAGNKKADSKAPAPPAKAAVAPADPRNSDDWKERWRAKAQEFKASLSTPR